MKNPLEGASVVFGYVSHPLATAAWNPAVGVFLLDYTMPGNESNSDMSGKCYWWQRSATARREVAKIVPLTERLSRVAAPESRLKGVLAKATCAHQRADRYY